MRNKNEILSDHERATLSDRDTSTITCMNDSLKLEVQIDIRDTLVEIAKHLEHVSNGAQIYQENHPV